MNRSNNKLWSFHGGLHLPGHKSISTGRAISKTFIPSRLILPLQQHIGESSELVTKIGDKVLKGQILARANGYVSVPLHAPTSGTITHIEEHIVPHPSGLSALCITIETDQKDEWIKIEETPDYKNMDPSALRNRIRDAGIVGLGGAGFPTFIKLNPGSRTAIDELIINAAECEPYISCDDMLMRERAQEIIQGVQIMQHALQARRCLIGIEDNKPEALAALNKALQLSGSGSIDIISIPTRYPAGGEKQLIKILTGKESPSHGLPLDIGVVCQNTGTAAAVSQAILHGKPLLSRVITLTGDGIKQPGNYDVLIGTPINELIEHSGGYHQSVKQLLMGGPMMGFNLDTDQLPVIKTTNCLLALCEPHTDSSQNVMPCIRCGACMDVCPVKLLPQQLYWQAYAKDFDKIQDYNLFDCIECGCCSYVCPSQIPLVQYYRFAKTEIWAQERDKIKSDHARERHEFRLERLEQEKREREERMRKKKAALQANKNKPGKNEAKKDAIAEALARVKAKQQNETIEPKNTNNLTPGQQQKIDDINNRRTKQKTVPDKQPEKNNASKSDNTAE
ncbi:MAG: electron transport complex subunit RsxC [Gammaproteobacteria bacterium]|nr:electron transport complex subunit RsxC [Gammaproteobacteria bacterium]